MNYSNTNFCGDCGQALEKSWGHCARCGHKIKRQAPSAPNPTPPDQITHQVDETPKKVKPRSSMSILATIAIVLILAFLAVPQTRSLLVPGVGTDASNMCQQLASLHRNYNADLQAFRSSPDDGSGWAPLVNLTAKHASELDTLIHAIENHGITWDSANIVTALLSSAKAKMNLIVSSAQRGYFAPGNDLVTLQNGIDVALNSVTVSACK